jgi:YidC/Oxa1 family membrane protein insertase
MDKRFISFIALSAVILFGSQMLFQRFFPQPPRAAQKPADKKPDAKKADDKKPDDKKVDDKQPAAAGGDPAAAVAEKPQPAQWAQLGSLDAASPYRMLITFNNLGAAVERVELNNPRYHEVDNIHPVGGYLGNLALENHSEQKDGKPVGVGCRVQVVGKGTPAEAAKIEVGDVITSLMERPTTNIDEFHRTIQESKPNSRIKVGLLRKGSPANAETVEVELRRHPLQLIRPEYTDKDDKTKHDPLSFLLTLQQVGEDARLAQDETELAGVELRDARWELLPHDPAKGDEVAFRRTVPGKNVEIVKRYTLERRDEKQKADTAQAYTLRMRIELKNTAAEARKLAYRLDGPTGLPVEGYWYSRDSKIGLANNCGMRDVTFGKLEDGRIVDQMITCTEIVDKSFADITEKHLKYVGVDAIYFTAAMLPQVDDANEIRYPRMAPIQVGQTPKLADGKTNTAFVKTVDVSFRLTSAAVEAQPGASITHDFKVYLGPKVPELLAENGLDGQIDYGWYDWVAVPMLKLLHTFYGWIGNYGIAIMMLTIVVRSCMFPISRKQALNAIKMQELQPELKKIAEKHKGDRQAQALAQQELWKKNNYNPLAGCLPVFLQLPIFVGLYNSLKVDVELRQAPLISENIRWASNLAAPDMFFYWERFLPAFLGGEEGWLGPFLNLLPLITITLFLVQQKMFMPPATDDNSRLQQKMMKYMMFFMGFMFFKVPAGLCVYFITSSIWSICEKQLLPKAKPATPIGAATLNVEAAKPTADGNRSGGNGKKTKRR